MRRGARRHVALAYAFSPIPACFGQKWRRLLTSLSVRDRTIGAMLRERAMRQADAVALVVQHRDPLSYGRLWDHVRGVADWLDGGGAFDIPTASPSCFPTVRKWRQRCSAHRWLRRPRH